MDEGRWTGDGAGCRINIGGWRLALAEWRLAIGRVEEWKIEPLIR